MSRTTRRCCYSPFDDYTEKEIEEYCSSPYARRYPKEFKPEGRGNRPKRKNFGWGLSHIFGPRFMRYQKKLKRKKIRNIPIEEPITERLFNQIHSEI